MTTLTQGVAERDAGMKRAADHADRVRRNWSLLAMQWLRVYCLRNRGLEFTAEVALEAAAEWGLMKPPTDRAWGPVFKRARKEGLIAFLRYEPCRKRHMAPTPLWRAV